jgi:outer membrane protein OmpA-like peptidoglycan-associated protein
MAFAAAVLLGATPAAAEEFVPEPETSDVAEAPIHDLQVPVHDLTLSIGSQDGSLTDSENQKERTVTLAADVLFEFDSADLTAKAETSLADAAEILKQDAGGKTVNIDGYTDAKGDDTYNQRLSEQRAAAVQTRLTALVEGIEVTFEVAGNGEADPVAPDTIDGQDNPEGRAKNRRVEIHVPR